jgi:hypothetical protein
LALATAALKMKGMDVLPGFALWRAPLEWLLLALAFAPFLIVVRCWATLPSKIPAHFDFLGRPDRWGGRWQIWLYPVISLPLYALFGAKMRMLPWLGAQLADTRMITLLAPAELLAGTLIAYVCWMSVKVARREAAGLHRAFFNSLVALLVVDTVAATMLWKR